MKEFIEKISPTVRTISSFLSYTGCILISLMIMYYLNGTIGIFLASALICALVLSLFLTLIARRTLEVQISTDTKAAAKGEMINCIVKLNNSMILPVPVAEVELECSPQLDMGKVSVFKCAVMGRMGNTVKIPLKAVHSGLAEVHVKRVALSDFLGIFTFALKVPEDELSFKAAVYPDIPDAVVQTDFLKTANRFSSNDDEEEESGETSQLPTGTAGYDHREYVPGDPIKRINWKLSSKRDIYMIRLDEQIHGTGQMFFLDCPVMEDTEFSLKVRDTVIEGALAMFMMLVREGRDATFYFCKKGAWIENEIHEQGDVLKIQELLSDYTPCEPPEPVPPQIAAAGKTPICFSSALKDCAYSAEQIASLYPEALIITAYESGVVLANDGHWTITDEFEFSKMN